MFRLSDFCWQDQTNSAECEPSDLRRTGGSPQTRTQQLITPGLMAFTLAHDYEDRCWRLKGQSSHNINKAEKKKSHVRMLPGFHICLYTFLEKIKAIFH